MQRDRTPGPAFHTFPRPNRAAAGRAFGLNAAALAALICCVLLSGCGAVALPCRVSSAALKVVPVVGHPAAAPFDACAAAID